ncbi:MAG: MBG domain-containing protein [Paludibacter sp.]
MAINKKKITVAAKKLTKVYGTTYTFSGKEYDTDLTQFVGIDSISQLQFSSLATPLKAAAGDYNLSITGILGYQIDNYDVSLVNSTFKVIPMPVTIIANDKTKEYSDLLTLSGNEFTTNTALISGDTILVVSLKSDGCTQTASIGNYSIQAAQAFGAGISNYDFSYTAGTLSVVKKKITAAIFPPAYLGYNAKTKDFSATINVSGLILNSDYSIRYTNKSGSATPAYNSTAAPSEAGEYTATFELSSSSLLKYELVSTSTLTQDFTITKAPLTITTDDQVKTYGDNISLNLLKYAFKTDMKPLFGSDRIDELELVCGGLSDTASVQTYTIKADSAKGPGVKNYDIHFINGTLTVNPKALNIAAIDNSKIYGEQINPTGKEFYVSPGSLVAKDSITYVSLQCNGFDKLATVGTSPIVASGAIGPRLSNYTISYKPATMVINKKKITVAAKKLTKVYGTTYTFTGKEYDTDLTQFVGIDSISQLQFSSLATPLKAAAGDYNLSITGILGYRIDNYDVSLVNSTFKVIPMPVTIIANDKTKEYSDLLTLSGNEFTTNTALISGDTILVVSLKSDGCTQTASIGNYSIQAAQAFGAGISNYDFSYTAGTLSVVKKKITAAIFPPAYLGYNAKTKDFSVTINVSGLILNSDYSIRYTNKSGSATPAYNSTAAPSEAGEYTATFELSSSSLLKYELVSTSTLTQDFTITKAPLTITTDDQVKTYGDNISLNLLKYAFKTDMKPLFGSDRIDELELVCGGLSDTASVRTYTIKADSAKGPGVKNYDIHFINGTLTVNPKALNIAAIDNSKIYGDQINPTGKEFYVSPGSLVGKDSITYVSLQCNGFDKLATVGTSPIVASGAIGPRLSNYTISYKPATMVINKKKITVAAKKLTKFYGTTYTFSGKEYDTDLTQFVGIDSISQLQFSSLATPLKAAAGDYNLSITGILGYRINNYNVSLVNNTFEVDPMPITITANDLSKPYGSLLTLNGSEFSTNKPLLNGDTISFVILKSNGCPETAPVDEYAIFALSAYGVGTMNYDFTYQPGKLSVTKKTLSAKIHPPAYLVYNAQNKEFTATVNVAGLVQNRDYSIRYTNRTGTNPYNSFTAPSTVGDYNASFELSSLSALKYFMDTIPSLDFSITKAPLTITADNATKTYGDKLSLQNDAFKVDMKPLFGSDIIFAVDFECKGLVDTASVKSYSISAIKVIGSGVENYDIRYMDGTLAVTPKQLTVKAVDNTKTYGDVLTPNSKDFYVDPRDLVGNDAVTAVTLASEGFTGLATIGSYPLKASNANGPRLRNYLIQYIDGNLQVTKKKINISAKPISKIYGNEYVFKGDEFEADLNQLITGDKITGVKLNSQGAQKKASVGEYSLSITDVSGYRLENYDIKMLNGLLLVTPKPIVVIAKNMEKEYGDVLSFAGNEFTTNIPLMNNDTISFVYLRSSGIYESAAIGEYDIIPSQVFGAGSLNYSISYQNGKLKITNKQLQVIAQNAVKEYGENDPEKKFSVYDKRGIEYIPTMFSGSISREPGEKVGEYAITKGTLSVTPSYSYTFTQGKFTIKKALPTIDPFFTNNAGEYIMADVLGSKNGDNPEGNLNIKNKSG